MLPLDYLKPCMAMIQQLVENFNASVVLCTATQPAVDSFFTEEKNIVELCPHIEEQFRFFKRVTYHNIGVVTKNNIADRLQNEKSVLCIVNTRKRAQELYKLLKAEGVYHLSTSMYPKHRKMILQTVRKRLNNNEKCILISTSIVEAGVDLDFKCVYRQVAGIDSIIQAAGRCNREGRENLESSIVYIFDFDDNSVSPVQKQQIDIAKSILPDYENICGLDCIDDYFSRLYKFRGKSLDKKNIMAEFKDKKYNFAKVGREFRLIEQNIKTIFINREQEADEILQDLKQKGMSKERMRKAGMYCIQVQNNLFDKLYGSGKLRPVSEDMQDFYELVNGSGYSEECGIDYLTCGGAAVFF